MADKPETTEATDRPEGTPQNIATNFQLNQSFVDEVGPQKATRFREVLVELTAEHSNSDVDVQSELRRRVEAIGVKVSEPELNMFADEIVRSVGPVEKFPGRPAGQTETPRTP